MSKSCVFNKLISYVIVLHELNLNRVLALRRKAALLYERLLQDVTLAYFLAHLLDSILARLEQAASSMLSEAVKTAQDRRMALANYLSQTVPIRESARSSIVDIKAAMAQGSFYMGAYTTCLRTLKGLSLMRIEEHFTQFDALTKRLAEISAREGADTASEAQWSAELRELAQVVSLLEGGTQKLTFRSLEDIFRKIQLHQLATISYEQEIEWLDFKLGGQTLRTAYANDRLIWLEQHRRDVHNLQQALMAFFQEEKKHEASRASQEIGRTYQAVENCQAFLRNVDSSN